MRALLERTGSAHLTLNGPCMRPWLLAGDEITVEPARWPPRPGAVVLLARGDHLFAHRVRAVHGGQASSRGDLSDEDDGWWGPEALLGEVVAARPGPRLPWRPPLDLRSPALRALMRLGGPSLRAAWRVARVARRRLRR